MASSSRRTSRETSPDLTDSGSESDASPAASPPTSPTPLPYSPPAALTSTFEVQLQSASRAQDTNHVTTPATLFHQSVPNDEFGRNLDYQKQLRLLEQQNLGRLRMDLIGRNTAPEGSNPGTTKPESQATERKTAGAPDWTPNNSQTTRLASLADYARLQYQIQQQQQVVSASSTMKAVDTKFSQGQLDGRYYPNSASNGFLGNQRPTLPRANSNCSSSSHHSAPCNAAATSLLESTLSSEELAQIQMERNQRAQMESAHRQQQQFRMRQVTQAQAAQQAAFTQESRLMPNYYPLPVARPPILNSGMSINATYPPQARYPPFLTRNYTHSSQYGLHNSSHSSVSYTPSSPPSFPSGNPASRSLSHPEPLSLDNSGQVPVIAAKRGSSDSTDYDRVCKKSKHTLVRTFEGTGETACGRSSSVCSNSPDITEPEFQSSRSGVKLPAGPDIKYRMMEERRERDVETASSQDHVANEEVQAMNDLIIDRVTAIEKDKAADGQGDGVLDLEARIHLNRCKIMDEVLGIEQGYRREDLQTDEDMATENEDENENDKASPTHSSATLDAEDENLNNGPLADLPVPLLPIQIEQGNVTEMKKTESFDTGISVTTTTFKDGKTTTWLRVDGEGGRVRAGSRMRREGVEIVTKTVVEGGRVTTTTTTALIPMGIDGMHDDYVNEGEE